MKTLIGVGDAPNSFLGAAVSASERLAYNGLSAVPLFSHRSRGPAMHAAGEPLEITVQDVKRLQESGEDFLFIDCREADERAICSIGGTHLVPLNEMPDRLEEFIEARDRRVVVHCHLGVRSLRAASWLRQQGIAQAQSMAGGIEQWAVEIEPGMARY